ncbi:MAG: lamin tail domain-containing protein [Gemmatimonadetes bacterium]|nr:lamin tail domain-containing protein [Gemmatimonadota bacterium]
MVRYGIGIVISGMLFFAQVLHTESAVVINEILADPPSGDRGDANRDGTRDGNKDEFIEILNTGSESIDIGGWQLSDLKPGSKGPFTFPENTRIDPGEYIVLFGGGTPTGFEG